MALVLGLLVFLGFVTYAWLSVLTSGVPLCDDYELWYINSEEGWDLVRASPRGVACGQSIGGVQRIAVSEVRLIGCGRNGWFTVERAGSLIHWVSEVEARAALADTRMTLARPGDLKAVYVFRSFWWVFVFEGALFLPIVLLIARGLRAKTEG